MYFLVVSLLVAQLFNSAYIPDAPALIIWASEKEASSVMKFHIVNTVCMSLYFNAFLLFQIGVESPYEKLSSIGACNNIRCESWNPTDIGMNIDRAQLLYAFEFADFLAKIYTTLVTCIPYFPYTAAAHCHIVLAISTKFAGCQWTLIPILCAYILIVKISIDHLIKALI